MPTCLHNSISGYSCYRETATTCSTLFPNPCNFLLVFFLYCALLCILFAGAELEELTIERKIEIFEDRFIDLRRTACEELANAGTSPQQLRITLMTLPSRAANQHQQFIVEKYTLFEEAKTIEEIFIHLNFYLNFLNYNLLTHIIKCHRLSPNLQQKMDSYCKDMELFLKETMIIDIIPYLPRKSKCTKGTEIMLKVDIDVYTTSLEDLEHYRKDFASELLLPDFALLLANLKKSSLLIVWLTPSVLVPALKKTLNVKRKELSFLSKFHILEIYVDGALVHG